MFKKLLALSAVCTLLFTGCTAGDVTNAQKHEDTLSIVCTLFPEYDWTREIIGEQNQNTQITYLLSSGLDLHNYQPSAKDMITISDCDLFIYVGGESESWVDDALKEVTNPDMKVIRLMDVLGDSAKEEEVKEGMQAEDEEDEETEEPEYDEHIWLSVKNAETLCTAICDTLSEIQPQQKEAYQTNLNAYLEKLDSLDKDFTDMAQNASVNTFVFADRFPFRYLADDYKINYYAAFAGCSAETEASFETVAFLANKIDELQLDTVFTIENADDSIAKAVISSTEQKNQQIISLNSMQSVNAQDIENGTTYLNVMQNNLNLLKEALN